MTLRAGDIIDAAMEHLSLLDIEATETVTAAQYAAILPRFDRMLKALLMDGSWRVLRERVKVSFTGDEIEIAAGGLVAVNPYKIVRIIRRHGNAKIDVNRISEAEYDQLPTSSGGSHPISFYEERRADGSIVAHIWPTLKQTGRVELVLQKRLADITSIEDQIELPDEWGEPISYRLALRVRALFGVPVTQIQDVIAASDFLWKQLELNAIESTAIELQ